MEQTLPAPDTSLESVDTPPIETPALEEPKGLDVDELRKLADDLKTPIDIDPDSSNPLLTSE